MGTLNEILEIATQVIDKTLSTSSANTQVTSLNVRYKVELDRYTEAVEDCE